MSLYYITLFYNSNFSILVKIITREILKLIISNLVIPHTKVKDFEIIISRNQLVKYLEILQSKTKRQNLYVL